MNDLHDNSEAYFQGWDDAVDVLMPTWAHHGDSPKDPNVSSYLRGYLEACRFRATWERAPSW